MSSSIRLSSSVYFNGDSGNPVLSPVAVLAKNIESALLKMDSDAFEMDVDLNWATVKFDTETLSYRSMTDEQVESIVKIEVEGVKR